VCDIIAEGAISVWRHDASMDPQKLKPIVLLVDDEEPVAKSLAGFLERSGMEAVIATEPAKALELARGHVGDVIVLDVLMPEIDGREVLRRLRQEGNWTPIIMLTRVGDPPERAMALEEGADDYLNKPFDPAELLARIRAVLRRADQRGRPLAIASRLRSDELVFDRVSRRVTFAGREISLTPKALILLEYFMTHPDELLSRERLLNAVWGWDYVAGQRAVDTRVAELRNALHDDASDPTYIETLTGMGYRFAAPVRGAK
jgi:DNA-binding response OmpR family regulator